MTANARVVASPSTKDDGWGDESWADEKDAGIPEVHLQCNAILCRLRSPFPFLQITVHEKDGLRVVFAFEVDKSPKTVQCSRILFTSQITVRTQVTCR